MLLNMFEVSVFLGMSTNICGIRQSDGARVGQMKADTPPYKRTSTQSEPPAEVLQRCPCTVTGRIIIYARS